MSDLVSLQLKTFHWVIPFNPDEALYHPACVTSLTSPPTTLPPPLPQPHRLAALLFTGFLRQAPGSGHLHLPFLCLKLSSPNNHGAYTSFPSGVSLNIRCLLKYHTVIETFLNYPQ